MGRNVRKERKGSSKTDSEGDAQGAGPRRRLLKTLAAGGGATVVLKSLPEAWSQPVVDTVFLPAHAQTTGSALFGSGQGGNLIVFGGVDPNDQGESYVFDDAPAESSAWLDWIPLAHAQGGPSLAIPGPGGIISATFYARALNTGDGGFRVKVLLRVVFPDDSDDPASAEPSKGSILDGLVGTAHAGDSPPSPEGPLQCVTDLTWEFNLDPIAGADLDAVEGYRTEWSKRRQGQLECGDPRSLDNFEARFRLLDVKSQTAVMQVDYGEKIRFGMKDNGSIPSANCEGKPCFSKKKKKKLAARMDSGKKRTYVRTAGARSKMRVGRKAPIAKV